MNPNSIQRDRLMAALSTAEHVVSVTPVIPTQLSVRDDCYGGYTLDIYFHHRAADVAEFAAAFATVTSTNPYDKGAKVFTAADGTVNGIPFHAWSLDPAEAPAAAPVEDEVSPAVAA